MSRRIPRTVGVCNGSVSVLCLVFYYSYGNNIYIQQFKLHISNLSNSLFNPILLSTDSVKYRTLHRIRLF